MSSGRSDGCRRGERLSRDLDSPVARDKGGTGKGMTTQLKLSPLFCVDNLHEFNSPRKLLDHLPKLLRDAQLFIIFSIKLYFMQ